jgi:hypothetical protein
MAWRRAGSTNRLPGRGGVFAVIILINYAASYVQENVVGKVAGVLSDLRRAMFRSAAGLAELHGQDRVGG